MRPLNRDHLVRLQMLCDRYTPESFSEHLAWSSHDDVYLNDLLPLPYTQQTLRRVSQHIREVKTALRCPTVLGKSSSYNPFYGSTNPQVDLLNLRFKPNGFGVLV